MVNKSQTRFVPPDDKPLYQEVISSIFKGIIDGTVFPGERLKEEDIAQELALSRVPVREAFQEMARQGILVIEPRKGARVATWDINYFARFGKVRIILENEAAEEAAGEAALVGTKDKFYRLLSLANSMSESYTNGQLDEAIDYDFEWHKLIVSLSKNVVLISLYESISLRVKLFMIEEKHIFPPKYGYQVAINEHLDISNSIIAGDPIASRIKMNSHLSRSISDLIKRMQLLMTSGNDNNLVRNIVKLVDTQQKSQ